ncbi:hypothetical protein SmJEL517_g03673 [Synchytrium microbalum]|uniref:Uncharacterized protein n=1 Tax=Synchytrium microbalum TaxID=1806994 RepID=A0A507C661_9FUNG|nr:uncharacterized protein SmJEL517_g03673 [Synchytrium microbalum]TPX33456.1 hypothetical protein SmJEL517_g03673 [Synchytrium microbalum]
MSAIGAGGGPVYMDPSVNLSAPVPQLIDTSSATPTPSATVSIYTKTIGIAGDFTVASPIAVLGSNLWGFLAFSLSKSLKSCIERKSDSSDTIN